MYWSVITRCVFIISAVIFRFIMYWSVITRCVVRRWTWWRRRCVWRTAASLCFRGTTRRTAVWTFFLRTAACPSSSPSTERAATTSTPRSWTYATAPCCIITSYHLRIIRIVKDSNYFNANAWSSFDIVIYTLENKGDSSQRCHRRTIFGSTKNLLVPLSYLFIIWRTFSHHKEAFVKQKGSSDVKDSLWYHLDKYGSSMASWSTFLFKSVVLTWCRNILQFKLYIYIYIYIYIYACIYVCVCVCIYIYIYIYTCMHAWIHIYICYYYYYYFIIIIIINANAGIAFNSD